MTIEKRNSKRRTARGTTPVIWVGGRQEDPRPSPRGGGYQNICAAPKIEKNRDQALEELTKMRIQRHWIEAAEVIGAENVLAIWPILDAACSNERREEGMAVPMLRYSVYLRFQRNRYIKTLAEMGQPAEAISKKITAELGERVSLRHIFRIKKQG